MKYLVRDGSGEVVARYEEVDGEWRVMDIGSPYFAYDPASKAMALIDAVLMQHREQGHVVSKD